MAANPDTACRAGGAVAFVYFRSPPNQHEAVRAAYQRLSLALREGGWPSAEYLALRHESARDDAPEYVTWLETYRGLSPDSLRAHLVVVERLAADFGLSALALNGRHTEIFEPCA